MVVINCMGGVDVALKNLRKRMQQEGRFTKIKEQMYYESKQERAKRRMSEVIKNKVRFARALKAKNKRKSSV